MSAGRKIGGIIALVTCFLLVFYAIYYLIIYFSGLTFNNIITLIVNLVLIIIGLLGSFMAISNKQAGGILILIVGIVSIVLGVLVTINPIIFGLFTPNSILLVYFGAYVPFTTLEAILLTLSGIIVIVSSE